MEAEIHSPDSRNCEFWAVSEHFEDVYEECLPHA